MTEVRRHRWAFLAELRPCSRVGRLNFTLRLSISPKLKRQVHALHAPVNTLAANWAYMVPAWRAGGGWAAIAPRVQRLEDTPAKKSRI